MQQNQDGDPKNFSKPRKKSFFGTSLSLADPAFLKNSLAEYKYVSPNLSLFEKHFLNQFWEIVVLLYPKWLAPNLITFTGFVAALVAQVLLLIFSPHLTGDSPRWWFLFAAFMQFMYQTLDGSDGKQARRTKSGSPLGELFDHGVDALVTTIISAFAIEMCAYGLAEFPVCMAFLGLHLAFFFSIFTALHTTKQRFGLIDCQEIQVFVQLALFITAFTGTELWQTKVPFPSSLVQCIPLWFYDWKTIGDDSLELRFICVILASLGSLSSAISAIVIVFQYYLQHGNGDSAKKEGRGIYSCLHQLFIVGLHTTLFVWSWFRAMHLRTDDSSVLLAWFVVYALTSSDLVNHTLLTRVGQLPFPVPWRCRCIIADAVFFGFLWVGSARWTIFARWVVVFLICVSTFHYIITMGNAICDALGIRFFKIPYKRD